MTRPSVRKWIILDEIRKYWKEKGVLPTYSRFDCSKSVTHKAFHALAEEWVIEKEGGRRIVKDFSWFERDDA